MIVVAMALLFLGLAVAIRHCQLLGQLSELDKEIEELSQQLDELGTDYHLECSRQAALNKQNEIRRKMLF